MKYPSTPVIPDAFRRIDTPEKAYLIGFLLADGCVLEPAKRKGFRVVLRILAEDLKVCQMLQEVAGGHIRMIENGYRVSWDVSSRDLALDLIAHGVTPRKSFTAAINWKRIPQSLHGAVLAGIIDGDGHIRFNLKARKVGVSIVTASPFLRDQLLERFPFFKVQTQLAGQSRKSDIYIIVTEFNRQLLTDLIGVVYDSLPFAILDRKQKVLDQIRAYLADREDHDRLLAEIPQFKAEGYTIQEIADYLGTSRRPVLDRLKKAGIKSRKLVFTDADFMEIRQLHEAGKTVLEIHACIGKGTEQAIRWHLQRMGLLQRTEKPVKVHPKARQILRLHKKGMAAYLIGEELGLTALVVRQVLRRAGFSLVSGSPKKLTEPLLKLALEELAKGRTLRSVAVELGVSETLIRLRKKELETKGADLKPGLA